MSNVRSPASISSSSPPTCWPLTQATARSDAAPSASPGVTLVLITRECGVVIHLVASVCLFCSGSNFWKPRPRDFVFVMPVRLQDISVKIVYQGHQVKVKVTGQQADHSTVNEYTFAGGLPSTERQSCEYLVQGFVYPPRKGVIPLWKILLPSNQAVLTPPSEKLSFAKLVWSATPWHCHHPPLIRKSR